MISTYLLFSAGDPEKDEPTFTLQNSRNEAENDRKLCFMVSIKMQNMEEYLTF